MDPLGSNWIEHIQRARFARNAVAPEPALQWKMCSVPPNSLPEIIYGRVQPAVKEMYLLPETRHDLRMLRKVIKKACRAGLLGTNDNEIRKRARAPRRVSEQELKGAASRLSSPDQGLL
jgi:hypothetical protein